MYLTDIKTNWKHLIGIQKNLICQLTVEILNHIYLQIGFIIVNYNTLKYNFIV